MTLDEVATAFRKLVDSSHVHGYRGGSCEVSTIRLSDFKHRREELNTSSKKLLPRTGDSQDDPRSV